MTTPSVARGLWIACALRGLRRPTDPPSSNLSREVKDAELMRRSARLAMTTIVQQRGRDHGRGTPERTMGRASTDARM